MDHNLNNYRRKKRLSYEDTNNVLRKNEVHSVSEKKMTGKDDELIIEDNAVYEIDMECLEKLKKMKKRNK
jgi:hypothetical protein